MERDFVGYGRHLPIVRWPDNARIAINFAVNYEEGAERSVPDGDATADRGEVPYPIEGYRDLANETNFEYGSRVGVWRLLDIFAKHGVKTTFLACARALERNPELGKELTASGHEPCSHSAAGVEAAERAQRAGVDLIAETCPQYLILDQSMEEQIGGWGKLIPPIRKKADQERL
jgi:peptidoglycan/xylan/chitin deacetylase (PgdA/CDA1 family)